MCVLFVLCLCFAGARLKKIKVQSWSDHIATLVSADRNWLRFGVILGCCFVMILSFSLSLHLIPTSSLDPAPSRSLRPNLISLSHCQHANWNQGRRSSSSSTTLLLLLLSAQGWHRCGSNREEILWSDKTSRQRARKREDDYDQENTCRLNLCGDCLVFHVSPVPLSRSPAFYFYLSPSVTHAQQTIIAPRAILPRFPFFFYGRSCMLLCSIVWFANLIILSTCSTWERPTSSPHAVLSTAPW